MAKGKPAVRSQFETLVSKEWKTRTTEDAELPATPATPATEPVA